MLRRSLIVLALLLVWAQPAAAFSKIDATQRMDDGVTIATTLYEPDGAAPAGGWAAVIVLHGLGGNRQSVDAIATAFASRGYAVLTYDARGHGASGGDVTLAGPREVADLRALRGTLAARPEVSDAKIGVWGISYGGGQAWNAISTGVPFAAAEVVETWTNLYLALFPQSVAKSGIVYGFTKSIDARSPLVASIEQDAAHSRNLGPIRALAEARSALTLGGVTSRVPVYMFQGRVDYAFDITQATQMFVRMQAPKKLYVGDFGHTPSTFPGPDVDYVLSQGIAWYDRWLKDEPNGIDRQPSVTIAKERWDGKPVSFNGLPPTRTLTLRPGARLKAPVETFGTGFVTLRVKRLVAYPRLVATVFAGSRVLTHGGLVPHVGKNAIRLANYAVYVRRGTRITVRLAADSGARDIAYLGFGDTGRISYRDVAIRLSVLRRPISG